MLTKKICLIKNSNDATCIKGKFSQHLDQRSNCKNQNATHTFKTKVNFKTF